MSEDKAMSRDEMVVGSYVCPINGGGPRGVVTRVELDQRGPEYDLLHVSDADGAMRCQRAVMRLVDPLPVAEGDEAADLRLHLDLLKVELKSAVDGRDMATSLLQKRQRDYDQMHAKNAEHEEARRSLRQEVQDFLRGMNEETERANKNAEELEALRLDHAALKSTYAETEAAHLKAHNERYALNEQNVELRRECDALRAKLVALEDGEAERVRRLNDELSKKIAQIDADCVDKVSILERKLRRAEDAARDAEQADEREREALAQAAAQRERADVWQAAAQDALDQMAHWRKQAIEESARCKAIADVAHDDQRLRYADQSRLAGLLDGMDRAKGISTEEGARAVKLEIVNCKGERRVMQLLASTCRLHHEPTEHYPRPTLKVTGYDIDRAAMRTVEIVQLRDEEGKG